MLESIAEEIECTFKYIVFSGESKKETECIKNYIPVEKVEFVDIVRIKTGFSVLFFYLYSYDSSNAALRKC